MDKFKDLLFKKWEQPPLKLRIYNLVTGALYGLVLAGVVIPRIYNSPHSKLILLICLLPVLLLWIPNKKWANTFKGKEGGYPRARYRQVVSYFMMGFIIPILIIMLLYMHRNL